MFKKTKGFANGGMGKKSKGYAKGGMKGMRKGGAAQNMTLAQIRSQAKKKGYKLVKA